MDDKKPTCYGDYLKMSSYSDGCVDCPYVDDCVEE